VNNNKIFYLGHIISHTLSFLQGIAMRSLLMSFLMILTVTLSAAENYKGGPVEVTTLDELKSASAALGRPAAILYMNKVSTCPLHNGQCSRWLENPVLANYIILKVDWKSNGAEFKAVQQLRQKSNDKAGSMIPMMFLVDADTAYKDVLPYNLDGAIVNKSLQKEVNDVGLILPVADVHAIDKELTKVSPLLVEGKTDSARTILKKVKSIAAKAPKAGFAKTYAEAESAFNVRVLADCEELLKPLSEKSAEERVKKINPILLKYKDLLSEATNKAITEAARRTP
jgi:hypothetical protein